mmetsp:Transcript_10893/g.25604  ORF Transcript_10893/g.25604 Transcript_10893/m.25604 type:complete len:238 (-) Transcript_10893:283-996(-)
MPSRATRWHSSRALCALSMKSSASASKPSASPCEAFRTSSNRSFNLAKRSRSAPRRPAWREAPSRTCSHALRRSASSSSSSMCEREHSARTASASATFLAHSRASRSRSKLCRESRRFSLRRASTIALNSVSCNSKDVVRSCSAAYSARRVAEPAVRSCSASRSFSSAAWAAASAAFTSVSSDWFSASRASASLAAALTSAHGSRRTVPGLRRGVLAPLRGVLAPLLQGVLQTFATR